MRIISSYVLICLAIRIELKDFCPYNQEEQKKIFIIIQQTGPKIKLLYETVFFLYILSL